MLGDVAVLQVSLTCTLPVALPLHLRARGAVAASAFLFACVSSLAWRMPSVEAEFFSPVCRCL